MMQKFRHDKLSYQDINFFIYAYCRQKVYNNITLQYFNQFLLYLNTIFL